MNIDADLVRELLEYSPSAGVFTWRERSGRWFKSEPYRRRWNTRFAGKRAGSQHTHPVTGYRWRELSLFDKRYKEHRLAWLYMTGEEPPRQIDHKNHDATDNKWANLRASCALQNSRNKSKHRYNRSGFTGVHWHKTAGVWQANGCANGKRCFLGSFHSVDDAAQAVFNFRELHGYHPSHGEQFVPYGRPDRREVEV
ncbi:MAG TPA: HNH endonuclease [Modicisalibacter sp.]|nr:HNH endonuclease [Modicisalibacter sp.]